MKLNKFKGRFTSAEQRYATADECYQAAGQFATSHPGAIAFTLSNGFSFQTTPSTVVEERFIYVTSNLIAPQLEYYEATEGGVPVHTIGALNKIYNALVNSGQYKGVERPIPNGGADGRSRPTVRCILQLGKTLDEEYLCLMVNPPFPNGHGFFKKHKPSGMSKYAPLLVGLAGSLVASLMWKKLGKNFGGTPR